VEGEYGSVEKSWRRVLAESARQHPKLPPGPRPRVTLATYRAHPNPKGLRESDAQRANRLTRVLHLDVPMNRQRARRLRLEDERSD
jgi:hypothetical protein